MTLRLLVALVSSTRQKLLAASWVDVRDVLLRPLGAELILIQEKQLARRLASGSYQWSRFGLVVTMRPMVLRGIGHKPASSPVTILAQFSQGPRAVERAR